MLVQLVGAAGAPPRVSTGARLPHLRSVEKRLDLEEVVEALLGSAQVLRPGEDEEAPVPGDGCAAPA
ncbi:hypothetical protein ACFCYB_32455 [Streptomyces sp. NPDC056309]|uniref:hypothetical protein n=1 Tax=unclassified Streptomyces TaxID=2593676 RepID=UPI0035D6D677